MRTRTRKATQALARGSLSLLLASTVALLQGCDSTSTGSQSGAGGSGSGGAASGGQTAGSGGSAPSGGVVASGGVAATGGTPATGGIASPSGGVVSSGGAGVTGGATKAGGVVASGGVTSAGGVTGQGGATKTPVTGGGSGHYQMENLDRGVVAVVSTGGVYVGWRMFGYEYTGTDSDTSYNLYKDGTKLINVTDSTNYLDATGTASNKYSVSAVLKGVEGPQSAAVTPWAQQYKSIAVTAPPNGTLGGVYTASDGATGDLDGDGQLDLVLKWDPSNSKDSASSGESDDCIIDGIKFDGTKLWRIDVGMNIRAGAHDTQMSVYDFDGDGKAELAIKTAPGTKDGTGNYLKTGPAAGADNSKDYRGTRGMALGGPEWMTVFDGTTGAERATVAYPVLYGSVTTAVWGDGNGNRSQRFNGGFAFVKDFLNGSTTATATGLPSIITGRGYYAYTTVSALTYRNGVLAQNWVFTHPACTEAGSTQVIGCGDHSEMAADVDGDLGQEIITGATTVGSDGNLVCNSGMGHGDAMDASELIPGKGITVFSIHESLGGMDAHDGATCSLYFKTTEPGTDSNRGRAEYVGAGDENSASCYCGSCNEHLALCADGTTSVTASPGTNFVIYWDDDEWRELENSNSISKATGGTLVSCATCAGCNGTKNTPVLSADLFGDWREEIIWRVGGSTSPATTELRLYTTTIVTKRRIYTLMHDPTYRAQVNFEQSAYNQPPHTGFQIKPNMPAPPVPNIFVK